MKFADVAPPDSGANPLLAAFGAVIVLGLIVILLLAYRRRRK